MHALESGGVGQHILDIVSLSGGVEELPFTYPWRSEQLPFTYVTCIEALTSNLLEAFPIIMSISHLALAEIRLSSITAAAVALHPMAQGPTSGINYKTRLRLLGGSYGDWKKKDKELANLHTP